MLEPGNRWERVGFSPIHAVTGGGQPDQAVLAGGRGSVESVLLGEPSLVGCRECLSPPCLDIPFRQFHDNRINQKLRRAPIALEDNTWQVAWWEPLHLSACDLQTT